MKYITLAEILRLHFMIVGDYGGSYGVRSEDRLKSVVFAPQQEVFGVEQYKGVYQKTAVYFRNIIADHPFVDGNKRTATTTAVIFLKRNGISLIASPKELEDFAVSIAVDHLTVEQIATWLESHSK